MTGAGAWAQPRPLSEEPNRVLYQIYVETFQDGSLRDGAGDFAGIEQRLGYLRDLGVGGLLLMPVFEGDGMGYIPRDYFKLRRDYGGVDGAQDQPEARRESLRRMIESAHRQGIKVFLDVPINHIGLDSDWFRKSERRVPGYEDFFIWMSQPNPNWRLPWKPGSTWQDVFHYDANRGQHYYALFGWGMPDLNHRSPAVQAEVLRFFRYWADTGVDGFRIDAAKHLVEGATNADPLEPDNRAQLQRYLQELRRTHPGQSFLLEAWSSDYGEFEPLLPDAGDVAFDFVFMERLRDSVSHDHPWAVRNALKHQEEVQGRLGPGNRIVFMGNHDVPRARNAFWHDRRRAELAFAVTLIQPAIPLIYYGDELFMPGDYQRDSSGGTKLNEVCTPMAWSAGPNAGFADPSVWLGDAWNRKLHSEWRTLNVESELADPQSLLNTVRELTRARSRLKITPRTRFFVDNHDPSDPVLRVAFQFEDGSCAAAVFNFTGGDRPGQALALPPGCRIAQESPLALRRARAAAEGRVDLGPYGFWVGSSAP